MTQNVAHRAYSAEQLLALRKSASDEPALAIETNGEERAIKGTSTSRFQCYCQAGVRFLSTPHQHISDGEKPTAHITVQLLTYIQFILYLTSTFAMYHYKTPHKTVQQEDPSPEGWSHHKASVELLLKESPTPPHNKHDALNTPLTDIHKDHVLRNARSFAARSTRSFAASDTLRPPSVEPRHCSGPILGEIDPNNQTLRPGSVRHRPSPTPSLKKKKAEHILNLHGSPPGLRVTAGGRIVPSDQSPLCSPRYGYSAIQKNGSLIRFAPNYPPPPTALQMQSMSRPLPNGFLAQDPNGRLLQMVDGQFLSVNEVNGLPQLYIAAPNLQPNLAGFPMGKMDNLSSSRVFDNNSHKQSSGSSGNNITMRQPSVSVVMQIQALEKQYLKLEQEARDLDKVEVLQKSSMSAKAYDQLVQKRRELVSRMNDIRVSLKTLRDSKSSSDHSPVQIQMQMPDRIPPPHQQMSPFFGSHAMPHGPLPGWPFDGLTREQHGMMQYPGPPMGPDYGFYPPPPGSYPGPMPQYPFMGSHPPPMFNMVGAPPPEIFNSFANVVNAAPQMFPAVTTSVMPSASGSESAVDDTSTRRPVQGTSSTEKESPRRSRALEIKNPENNLESGKPGQVGKFALNPMSPSYQPAPNNAKAVTPASKQSGYLAGSPSPALAEAVRAHNAWVGESTSSANSQRAFRYDSSASSYATADFFPNNPRDHSMNKLAYPATSNRSTERIREGRPSTPDEAAASPEKEHHNPNWNPTIPDAAFESVVTTPLEQEIMAAPPGTPANGDVQYKSDPIDDRSKMNVSPKSKRPDLLKYRSVSVIAQMGSVPATPAPLTGHTRQEQQIQPSGLSQVAPEASAYEEGFKAGTARLPIGPDKIGSWLDGYCAGLLGSNERTQAGTDAISAQQTVVPQSSTSNSKIQTCRPQASPRPALELNTASFDTLKEVVFSKQNENALLSPDPNGPTANEMASLNLSWVKGKEASVAADAVLSKMRNGEAAFPERTSSMVHRQLTGLGVIGKEFSNPSAVLETPKSDQSPASQTRRAVSVQSQPSAQASYLQRAYPGQRILSNQLEWKAGSSIAQVAGLATGYFAQYDGTLNDLATLDGMAPLTRMSGNVGTTVHDSTSKTASKQATTSSPQQTRFKEATMQVDEHPGSVSPPPSPTKKSPAKAKFAHIAGKAGIKVHAAESKEASLQSTSSQQPDLEPMSPQEKRRWRDVWKKRFTEEQQQQQQSERQH